MLQMLCVSTFRQLAPFLLSRVLLRRLRLAMILRGHALRVARRTKRESSARNVENAEASLSPIRI